ECFQPPHEDGFARRWPRSPRRHGCCCSACGPAACLALLASCLPAVQPRDFTVKDIVYLHPSTTPYPHGFKCFTCEKAADNYECNRWAPDVYCPR
ncbi:PREDICTED: ly6/PLAUR domain-containing protein 6-like, partial [Phaethon lepturus]|uniref:ly6/PLAUR domain-containing protein 6-like n=1 Tax=Phaethon lepturus TaxID=97097 RepID=UPI000530B95F